MRIQIVTPAARGSRKGNRVTADRYAAILRDLGHRVAVDETYSGQTCDLLIALHARKSHDSMRRFRRQRPTAPLIVVMTGTDLYGDLPNSRKAMASLEMATRIVLLQPDGIRYLQRDLQYKTVAILQSAEPPRKTSVRRSDKVFEVSVLGHLRSVKDPFRTPMAARRLPTDSRIRVLQLGAALTPAMERRALAEVQRNRRYEWLGDVPRSRALQILARSRLTVVSSKLEGGANVVAEALAVGTPVLASRISGNLGMLGPDYPGYFAFGDTAELAVLLHRAETDAAFHDRLTKACEVLAPRFSPERERAAWRNLLAELTNL